jgi:hypothetical protein
MMAFASALSCAAVMSRTSNESVTSSTPVGAGSVVAGSVGSVVMDVVVEVDVVVVDVEVDVVVLVSVTVVDVEVGGGTLVVLV